VRPAAGSCVREDGHGREGLAAVGVIDREGVVRHVHPGGQYVKGDKAYDTLKAQIEELLKRE
jgi:hypothetical protein